MTIDVGFVVAAMSFHPVTIERRSGSYLAGRWVAGPTTVIPVNAAVQPIQGRELRRLPEGQRTDTFIHGFFETSAGIQAGDVNAGMMPDVVVIGGERYQAERVEDWGPHGYRRALLRREGI